MNHTKALTGEKPAWNFQKRTKLKQQHPWITRHAGGTRARNNRILHTEAREFALAVNGKNRGAAHFPPRSPPPTGARDL